MAPEGLNDPALANEFPSTKTPVTLGLAGEEFLSAHYAMPTQAKLSFSSVDFRIDF